MSKELKPLSVWSLAFGCIIGWGAFINPGLKFLPNSGPLGTSIAMLLGAIVMIIIAYSYAYMVPKYPSAGGEYTFTYKLFGKVPAFICGWFLVAAYLTNVPMNATTIPLIFESVFNISLNGYEYLIMSGVLIIFGILNILGIKLTAIVQTVLSILLVSCVVCLSVACYSQPIEWSNLLPIWGTLSTSIFTAVFSTFVITPWAFVGFDTIPQAAEEFNFSNKKVMLIMILAILFGAFVYITNTVLTALTLQNWPELVQSGEWVLLVAAEQLLGSFGKILIAVGVISAVLTGIMGFYLASSRLVYSMSKDGYISKKLSIIDSKYKTPKYAIVFCILISLVSVLLGRQALSWFVDMSSVGTSVAFLFTCLSAYICSKKLICLAGTIFSLLFLLLQLLPLEVLEGIHLSQQSYIMLLLWIVLGIIILVKLHFIV